MFFWCDPVACMTMTIGIDRDEHHAADAAVDGLVEKCMPELVEQRTSWFLLSLSWFASEQAN